MTEEDPFYIKEEQPTEPAPASTEEPLIELEELKLGPDEEHGFAMVEQVTKKPSEQILLFSELGGLLRVATDKILEGSHTTATKAKKKAGQFVVGTMIALAWGSGGAKPAEAIDWGRHIPTGISIAGQIGTGIFARKAEQHARMAEFLAEAPERVERLKDRISDIDQRIERAVTILQDAKETKYRKERVVQDINHLRLARAECIDELLWLQKQLVRAAAEGKTAQSEAQKARNNALGAQISETIEREAAWASMWGW